MLRSASRWAMAAAFLLLPTRLMAGGPPQLCLPVDGVTSKNAQACIKQLDSKLGNKIWRHSDEFQGVKVVQRTGQWYLAFYMDNDVRLSDVKAALEGTEFSIPRERLRLFGHLILEVDARPASRQDLLADLKDLPHVAVAESKTQENRLLVTLDMPYPIDNGTASRELATWNTFQRGDLNSTTQPRTPTTPQQLPSFEKFRDLVSKHEASLKDIRWSTNFACRIVGGVAEPQRPANEAGSNKSTETTLPGGK